MEAIWSHLLLRICVFTPSFLPSKKSRKQEGTPPLMLRSHPPLSPMEIKTLPHSPAQPPQAHGFSPANHKRWVHKGPEGLEFLSSFKGIHGNNTGKNNDRPTPSPLLRAHSHPFLPAHLPHSLTASQRWVWGWKAEWLFSTETAPTSTLSALTLPCSAEKKTEEVFPYHDPSAVVWASF